MNGAKQMSLLCFAFLCNLPAMCKETSICMSGAITTWGGTSRPLCFKGLPVEWCAIKETLLLSAGCKWTPVGTTVCGVLSTDVTQAVTARHWASTGNREKEGERNER